LALAALLFALGSMAAALAAGGSVPMIALGLILAAVSMHLFLLATPPDEK
jgi:predicted tellurium resistance membrane protein TerC